MCNSTLKLSQVVKAPLIDKRKHSTFCQSNQKKYSIHLFFPFRKSAEMVIYLLRQTTEL